MKVLKFGGTSVGSAQRMKEVAKLITDGERKIVVLSAMSGTTNTLVEISDYLYKKNPEGANEIINKLESKYRQHIDELFATPEYKQKGLELIKSHFDYIRSYTKDLFTLFEEKVVLAQGELISTAMMNYYLQECGVKSVLLPALEYMRTDKNAEPDPVYIKDKLQVQLELHPDAEIYNHSGGTSCRNAYGEIDNLQRGGSDYTASLIGAAINASEIQILDGYRRHAQQRPPYCGQDCAGASSAFRRGRRAGILRCQDSAPYLHPACQVCQYPRPSAQYDGPHCSGYADFQ